MSNQTKKPFTMVAVVVLAVVSLAHLIRVLLGLSWTVGDYEVGMLASIAGFVVAAVLAVMVWREARA